MDKQKIEKALYLINMDMDDTEVLYKDFENNSSTSLIEEFMGNIVSELEVELIASSTNSAERLVIGQAKLLLNKTEQRLSEIGDWLPELVKSNKLKNGEDELGITVQRRLLNTTQSRYRALKYMQKMLANFLSAFETGDKNLLKKSEDNVESLTRTSKLAQIDRVLDNYGDTLTNRDLMKIFHVERNALYRYRREGYLKASPVKNNKVIYLKSDVREFMMIRT